MTIRTVKRTINLIVFVIIWEFLIFVTPSHAMHISEGILPFGWAVVWFVIAIPFMAALSWMRIPKGFIYVFLFAYRYIFMLFDDTMIIYNAQKNWLSYFTIRRELGSFGILTGSLVLKAFESSQSTALAMAQRGYNGNMPTLEHQSPKYAEVFLAAIFIVLMDIIWNI